VEETINYLDPQEPDLIWPLQDIYPALDRDVIRALGSIYQVLPDRSTQLAALQKFIAGLWIDSPNHD